MTPSGDVEGTPVMSERSRASRQWTSDPGGLTTVGPLGTVFSTPFKWKITGDAWSHFNVQYRSSSLIFSYLFDGVPLHESQVLLDPLWFFPLAS